MLRELAKVEFWSLYIVQEEGQEAAILDQGIVIIIGTRILKGEAEVEVGTGMTVIGTVEETRITVVRAEATALITAKITRGKYDEETRSRSRSHRSVSPACHSVSPRRSPPRRTTPSRDASPDGRNHKDRSPTPKSVSPRGRRGGSLSPLPHSDSDD